MGGEKVPTGTSAESTSQSGAEVLDIPTNPDKLRALFDSRGLTVGNGGEDGHLADNNVVCIESVVPDYNEF